MPSVRTEQQRISFLLSLARLVALLLCVRSTLWDQGVEALSAVSNAGMSIEAKALCEWLMVDNRCALSSVKLTASDDQATAFAVIATRDVIPGELLFRLRHDAIWSAAAAYHDRDLGPKLRDLAAIAGPGFGVVAFAGVVAAERLRRFRSREGLGLAPESAGQIVPSQWGALARWFWSRQEEAFAEVDKAFATPVRQGVELLVPLLDVAARRAWSLDAASLDSPEAPFLSEKWARWAMQDDGAALSWSRGDLERVALASFRLVMDRQVPPPPYLLEGVGSLIPAPFVGKESPELWQSGEPLAILPLMDQICVDAEHHANAVIGSPPPQRREAAKDSVWCVATSDITIGERVCAFDPWL